MTTHVQDKVSLRRVRINSGGYDDSGYYWGIGQRLYHAAFEDGQSDLYFRADNREDAKLAVLANRPDSVFYR
jgi:hypothetical protein